MEEEGYTGVGRGEETEGKQDGKEKTELENGNMDGLRRRLVGVNWEKSWGRSWGRWAIC